MSRTVPALCIAVVLACPTLARADVQELTYRPELDLPITLTLGAAWISSEILKDKLAKSDCSWCNPPGFDARLRRGAMWDDIERADTASDIVGFYALPLAALGLDLGIAAANGSAKTAGVDALIVLESITISSVLTQITKFAIGRERPFVHALPEAEKGLTKHPEDNNLSFISGHTSLAFAVAVSTGTTMMLRQYEYAWVSWVTLLPAAIAVAYLRIAADRHYFTDVFVGALVGSGVGFAVPWLHRPNVGVAAGATRSRTPIVFFSFQF